MAELTGVVAVDGPGGVGKSTVSRCLATRLGVPHLDTGAGYRAATVAVLAAGVDPTDRGRAVAMVERAGFAYEDGLVRLDGEDITEAVRQPEVTGAVSAVSAIPGVRRVMVGWQRDWVAAHGGSAVVEGRDIGTVVFPEAAIKVFLDARPEVRAHRRAGDRESQGRAVGDIAADLERRDRLDRERVSSPLRPAADAVVIDTSDLGVDEVVERVMASVRGSGG